MPGMMGRQIVSEWRDISHSPNRDREETNSTNMLLLSLNSLMQHF